MKQYKNYLLAASALILAATMMTSCEDEPDKYEITGGKPTIHYIRSPYAASSDSLLVSASLNSTICIVGDNLTSIYEMYFNDQKAILNTSYITDHTMIVEVPGNIPVIVSNKIFMVNLAKDTVTYDFKVSVPAPLIASVSNEWTKAGEEAVIYGDYFDNANNMLRVKIGDVYCDIKDGFTKNAITFVVPENAKQGDKFSVETINGSVSSTFLYKDNRGMITDFDGEGNSGTKGIVPQGWNLAVSYSEEGGVDGYYAQVGPVETDGGWTESLKISWWCGNWNGDPMSITDGAGVPLRNIFPVGYFDKPENLAVKFELCIPSSNPWKAGALQVVFANNETCANDSWQNNNYIKLPADGGPGLCRGLYRPWALTGSFDTADKWITVTMPIADFKYNMDGTPGLVPIAPESFDSFTIWPINGGIEGETCEPILRYDNIRIVPIK